MHEPTRVHRDQPFREPQDDVDRNSRIHADTPFRNGLFERLTMHALSEHRELSGFHGDVYQFRQSGHRRFLEAGQALEGGRIPH